MINHYELLYLVAANYTEEELVPIKDKVKDIIGKFEGEITLEDSLGKKKLAYPIKGTHQGYYLIFEFDLDGSNLKPLNNELKLTNELLRHVVVKKNKKMPTSDLSAHPQTKIETKPSMATLKKEERKKTDEKDKIKLEDLDQRLDEILEGDIM